MTRKLEILNFGQENLPFDSAQGGELVEPFDIWDLLFEIYNNPSRHIRIKFQN